MQPWSAYAEQKARRNSASWRGKEGGEIEMLDYALPRSNEGATHEALSPNEVVALDR